MQSLINTHDLRWITLYGRIGTKVERSMFQKTEFKTKLLTVSTNKIHRNYKISVWILGTLWKMFKSELHFIFD